MAGQSKLGTLRMAVKLLVDGHFEVAAAAVENPGRGGRKKKADAVVPGAAVDAVVAVADAPGALVAGPVGAPAARDNKLQLFTCKTCGASFKDTSNARALEHLLLTKNPGVKLCSNPQVTAQEYQALVQAQVPKAAGFEGRLEAHQKLGLVTAAQPSLQDVASQSAMLPEHAMKELQKQQVKASISQGCFNVNRHLNEDFLAFLKALNPGYRPPTRREVEAIRDELHEERLKERDTMIQAMGPRKHSHRRMPWQAARVHAELPLR